VLTAFAVRFRNRRGSALYKAKVPRIWEITGSIITSAVSWVFRLGRGDFFGTHAYAGCHRGLHVPKTMDVRSSRTREGSAKINELHARSAAKYR